MAKPYVPIFFDWLEITERLSDEEKGRLIDAIVMYAAGQDYNARLTGIEAILFPAYKANMDRVREKAQKRAAAGAAGGNRKAANRKSEEEPTGPEPFENPFGDHDDSGPPDTIEAYCANNLSFMSMGNFQELESYREDLTDDMIQHAVDDACGHAARSWAYVKKILNEYVRKGYKTLGDVLAAEGKKGEGRAGQKPQAMQPENPLDRTKFY